MPMPVQRHANASPTLWNSQAHLKESVQCSREGAVVLVSISESARSERGNGQVAIIRVSNVGAIGAEIGEKLTRMGIAEHGLREKQGALRSRSHGQRG